MEQEFPVNRSKYRQYKPSRFFDCGSGLSQETLIPGMRSYRWEIDDRSNGGNFTVQIEIDHLKFTELGIKRIIYG